jgi:hypothetical protein
VTAEVSAGWTYLKVEDMPAGYRLTKVLRSDGTELPLGDMVWRTTRTFRPGDTGATLENRLHLVDRNSTGTYTLMYQVDDSVAPTVTAVQQPPAVATAPVATLDITFSEAVDLSTLTTADLTLTRNGVALDLSGASIALVSGSTYRVSGLAGLTGADGNYVFSVDGRTVRDLAGNAGTNLRSATWAMAASSAVVTAIETVSPDPRNVAVGTLEVEFSRAIDGASFGVEDLLLTRDWSGGGARQPRRGHGADADALPDRRARALHGRAGRVRRDRVRRGRDRAGRRRRGWPAQRELDDRQGRAGRPGPRGRAAISAEHGGPVP